MSALKKIFIGSFSLFIISLLLWGIYWLSFRKPASPTTTTTEKKVVSTTLDENSKAKNTAAKIVPLSDEPVLAATFFPEASAIRYYAQKSGRAYQINLDGQGKRIISDKELIGLSGVNWSPSRNRVITQFAQNGSNKFFYYDYATNKGVQLKDNLDTVVWKSDDQILYKYYDAKSGERSLNVAAPDGSNWKKLTNLSIKDLFVAPVPATGLASFWNRADANKETAFATVSILGAEPKTIFSGKFGADFLWNADGTKLLISHLDAKGGNKLTLAVVDNQGEQYKDLGIPTLANKVAWSKNNKTLYFALAGSIPANSVLPNDYWAKKFYTTDTFWKVNLETGEKERLVDLDKIKNQFDATDLFVNADESMLFFTNRVDGLLYRIDL